MCNVQIRQIAQVNWHTQSVKEHQKSVNAQMDILDQHAQVHYILLFFFILFIYLFLYMKDILNNSNSVLHHLAVFFRAGLLSTGTGLMQSSLLF